MGDSTGVFILIVICIIFSAFFSATETSFSSLNRIKIKNLAGKGNKRAALVLKLSDDYDSLLSTILIGNNIVNIACSALFTILFVRMLGEKAGASASTVLTTIIVLIFGEVSPKSIAKEFPEKFAMFSAPIIRMFLCILTPINFLFRQWKKLLLVMFKTSEDKSITEEELLTIVEEAEQDGGIGRQEGALIRNAIEFSEVEACEIMVPRMDVVAISADVSDYARVAHLFADSGFSRLPVYEGTRDHIVGVLHQKDFCSVLSNRKSTLESVVREGGAGEGERSRPDGQIIGENPGNTGNPGNPGSSGAEGIEDVGDGKKIANADIRSVMKPAIYVPENNKIGSLLKELQRRKLHMAVVIDEFGGTSGIVTMEDILEELVGDIWDEHDKVIHEIEKVSGQEYIVLGNTNVEKLFDLLELPEEEFDVVTVSGWVTELFERIPREGEKLLYGDCVIEVLKLSGQRIEKIRIRADRPGEESDENGGIGEHSENDGDDKNGENDGVGAAGGASEGGGQAEELRAEPKEAETTGPAKPEDQSTEPSEAEAEASEPEGRGRRDAVGAQGSDT